MSAIDTQNEAPWSIRFDDLSLTYRGAVAPAVASLTLDVAPGQILAIIGETGSGKSTLVRAALGLLAEGAETSGRIRVRTGAGDECEPLTLKPAAASAFRRENIGYVPQLTQRALVPVLSVFQHFEQFSPRARAARGSLRSEATEALLGIGLQNAAQVLDMYPHQLSGGMAQRVCIALAMFGGTRIVIADEPTSGLDALVRRRVADLLDAELRRPDTTTLLVTHDLALARRLSTHVAVLFRGALMEAAPTEEFFTEPRNAYSKHLLASIPQPGHDLPEPYDPSTFFAGAHR